VRSTLCSNRVNRVCMSGISCDFCNSSTNRGRRFFPPLLVSAPVSSVTYLRGTPAPVQSRLCRAAVFPTDKSRRNITLPAVASEKASYPCATFAVIPLIIDGVVKSLHLLCYSVWSYVGHPVCLHACPNTTPCI